MKIEGKYIISLILEKQDGTSENLSSPGKLVKLPVGKYFVKNLVVSEYDQYSIGTKPKPESENGWIFISKDKPAVLKAGAPLKQIIETSRQGNYLILNYKIIDSDGNPYFKTTNNNIPPEFQIYKGDKLIVSDKFQYG